MVLRTRTPVCVITKETLESAPNRCESEKIVARQYYVYVIGLEDSVGKSRRFRAANPGYRSGRPCVYVGSTARSPEERFEQHLNGSRSNRFVRKYGLALLPTLYDRYNPIPSRPEAEELERYLAERLRNSGFGVWSN
jgi:ribosomal protein L36